MTYFLAQDNQHPDLSDPHEDGGGGGGGGERSGACSPSREGEEGWAGPQHDMLHLHSLNYSSELSLTAEEDFEEEEEAEEEIEEDEEEEEEISVT